jgi:hypothetical protein
VLRFSPYFLYLDRMAALGEKLENSNHSAAGIGKPGFRMRRPTELGRSRLLDAVAFVIGGQQKVRSPKDLKLALRPSQ